MQSLDLQNCPRRASASTSTSRSPRLAPLHRKRPCSAREDARYNITRRKQESSSRPNKEMIHDDPPRYKAPTEPRASATSYKYNIKRKLTTEDPLRYKTRASRASHPQKPIWNTVSRPRRSATLQGARCARASRPTNTHSAISYKTQNHVLEVFIKINPTMTVTTGCAGYVPATVYPLCSERNIQTVPRLRKTSSLAHATEGPHVFTSGAAGTKWGASPVFNPA